VTDTTLAPDGAASTPSSTTGAATGSAAKGPQALIHDIRHVGRRLDDAMRRPGAPDWIPTFAVVVLLGLLLGFCGGYGATALLVAIAITQAIAIVSWVYGTQVIGRKGAILLGAMAAAASDVCISLWPQSRLGALLGVFALAIPVLFVYQLARGVARHNVVASLSGISALIVVAIGPAALLQLRHEFTDETSSSRVVGSVIAVMAGGLALSLLVDAISPFPQFDAAVRRGVMGVLASAGLGASIGYLALQSPTRHDFSHGRGALVGLILGLLVALLSVAAAFAMYSVRPLDGANQTFARWSRIVLVAVVPLAFLSPVAFLICVAVRV
jgi:hypothetical protein